jgi:hypothetical protein
VIGHEPLLDSGRSGAMMVDQRPVHIEQHQTH